MKMRIPASVRKWLFLPPVLLGIGIVAWLMLHSREPQKNPPMEIARVLRVIEAPRVNVVPRVLGHGTARPAQVWRAVAEVEGRVVVVHSELSAGAFLKTDEVVLKIAPCEYELAISRVESELAEIEARLAELATQEENDRASLEIEQASLELARVDLERTRDAREREAASPTEVRAAERAYLIQRQKAQALQNALNLAPRQRTTLQASLAVRKSQLEQARLDVQKTVIRAPFDCRVGEVQIEIGQFLKTGEVLFEADGIAASEVDAQVSIDRARNLLPIDARQGIGLPDTATLRELFQVEATVRMRIGDFATEWPARFVRIREQMDPMTRTAAIVVAVDRSYERAIPGQRPPLVKGTFCEVELRGKHLLERVVIPRAALHGNHVYVIDAGNRLQRCAVDVLFAQSDFLCIDRGLEAGDRVVVSDPSPAIEGMLVDPVVDQSLTNTIMAQAQAGTGVR